MKATKKKLIKKAIRPKFRFTFGRGAQRGYQTQDKTILPGTARNDASARKPMPSAKKELPRSAGPGGAAVVQEPLKTRSGVDLTEKIQELVNLPHERGYLTADDINEAF